MGDDPKQTPTPRTKMGRMEKASVGLPAISIGVLPSEPLNGGFFKAVWVEFVCTLLFLYMTTGSVVFGCSVTDTGTDNSGSSGGQTSTPSSCFLSTTRVLAIATSFGLSILVLVYAAAPFSGGHINPAVSWAFFITKKLSLFRLIAYWIAQFSGAIIGSFFVKATYKTGFAAAVGATNTLLTGFDKGSGWLLETVLTFLLVFIVFVATDQARGQSTAHVPVLAPLAIGFAVFICHLAAIPLDGCSINPARSFGPAVVSGHWSDLWIFFAGPFSGATIAALVYELTFRISREPVLTIDRQDDAAQTAQTAKLPGYTGAAGLPSSKEARDMLGRNARSDSANDEVTGPGHIKHGGSNTHNGQCGTEHSMYNMDAV